MQAGQNIAQQEHKTPAGFRFQGGSLHTVAALPSGAFAPAETGAPVRRLESNMKKSIITVVVIVLLIGLFAYTALFGLGSVVPSTSDGVVLGLDLVGGSEITYEAQVTDETSQTEIADGIKSAMGMLRQRLDVLGYTEANVYQSGDQQIVVEIPNVDDPEEAVNQLGSTAIVEFLDADGTVWLSGSDIASASYQYSAVDQTGVAQHHVVLEFTKEGQEKFAEATKSVASRLDGTNYLLIEMDGEEISRPYVESQYAVSGIDSETAIITLGNNATAESATYLANIISAGQLPFSLECVKLQTVGASLGERSLESSLLAGLIGLAIVMVFMIVVYRVMGVVSCLALALYTTVFAVLISVFHINLSLPGIAGIILTIGMAVDANVVIYERIKEELHLGKTLRYAIESGYKGALRAIIDANITTIIAAAVLWIWGTGTIISFAQTLLIGVILSMIIMLVITRMLLRAAVGLKITNPKAYCA